MSKVKELEVVIEKNVTPFLFVLVVAVTAFLAGSYYQPKSGAGDKNSQVVQGLASDSVSTKSESPATVSTVAPTKTDDKTSIEAAGATSSPQVTPEKTVSTAPAATGIVNINTGSLAELETLTGIGEVKAQAIIDYRTQNGPYRSVDQLDSVKGIGPATIDKIRDKVTI